jgi:hypothetical protein
MTEIIKLAEKGFKIAILNVTKDWRENYKSYIEKAPQNLKQNKNKGPLQGKSYSK